MLKPVHIYYPVRKLIRTWPAEVKGELGTVLMRLQRNEFVGMPDVRAMPSVGRGGFEVRIKASRGAFRAFYVSIDAHGIAVFHAFQMKTQQTGQKEIETGTVRLRAFMAELGGG